MTIRPIVARLLPVVTAVAMAPSATASSSAGAFVFPGESNRVSVHDAGVHPIGA